MASLKGRVLLVRDLNTRLAPKVRGAFQAGMNVAIMRPIVFASTKRPKSKKCRGRTRKQMSSKETNEFGVNSDAPLWEETHPPVR